MALPEGKNLVVIDDDRDLARLVAQALEAEGFAVSVFHDAPQFLQHLRKHGLPHLAIVDLKLPSMHGFELSEKLKALGDVPIIFISTVDTPDSIIAGIEHYADDYVTKPFNLRELVVRVRRVLSRITDLGYAQSPLVTVDEWLSIDFANARVIVGEKSQDVLLTRTEARLLYLLLNHAGTTLPADILLARIWPFEEVYEDTLRVHIHRLRQKIEPDPSTPRYIHTVRGVGYTFYFPTANTAAETGRTPVIPADL